MYDLTIFNNPQFGQVRSILRNGEPWFVAADVCRALEVANPSQAVARLDDDERAMFNIGRSEATGGGGETNIINEPGLYSLVLGSRKPEARAFKRWITHEVIPAIRKTGSYSTDRVPDDKLLRAQAMHLNAKTRQFKAIMSAIGDKSNLSQIAVEVFGLRSIEQVYGVDVGSALPVHERTYSATDVGARLGISANRVGKIANSNGLKTDEYGIWVMDKSRHSNKEVSSFRYNENGVATIERFHHGTVN